MSQYQNHRILILNGTKTINEYVSVADIYIHFNRYTKILRKLHEHTSIPFEEVWYGEWKQRIKNYDVFIIFDALREKDIITYIHKINPAARIIIYYINKIKLNAKNDPKNFMGLPCDLWSFDKGDCEKMQMRFNPFCYDDILVNEESRQAINNNENTVEIYDAFFIGVDKNRFPTLVELNNLLKKYGYKTMIIVRRDRNKKYQSLSGDESIILTNNTMEYKDVIKLIQQSKAIIEIQVKGQKGLTLRAMESLFFKKKLITDNLDILNYDFYKKENIFLLGHDSEKWLETFMLSPYEPVNDDIVHQYTWESWLERFFK